MGFFNKFGKKLHKFGQKVEKGVHAVAKVGGKIENFVEKKALPIAKAVSKGLDVGLKIATPVVGMVAPEFLPAVMGAEKVVGGIRKGIKVTEKGLKLGKQVSQAGKDLAGGNIVGGISGGVKAYKQTQEMSKNPFS